MRSFLVNLAPQHVLLVRGPATVICQGTIFVLGMDASQKEISVSAGKVLPFEASGVSRARVRLGKGSNYKVVRDGKVGVPIWEHLASVIARHEQKRIMLVGAADTGKSTLATYLSNVAIKNGLKVSIVDGDVGQGDLAPPSCIGATRIIEQFVDLRNLNAEYYSFIGSTSPRSVEDFVIRSIKDLADKLSARSDICIVNTDGYVDEHGIDYKIQLAKALKPDLVVYLGNPAKARRLFDEFAGGIVHANAPERISKTHSQREKRRLDQYRRFIENGGDITFEIGSKKFGVMDRLYDMISLDGLVRIGSTKFLARSLWGMFVGLGKPDRVTGFGTIVKVANGRMTVHARYEGDFDTVFLSAMRLSRDMKHEYRIPLALNVYQRSV